MASRTVDYLLIGGGRTSANAAQAIRESDPQGSITLVAGENRKPYDRPPLSKNFLEGRPPNPDDVESKPDDFFDKHRVELLRGISAVTLDREQKAIELSDGTRLEYGKLLLATGASPVPLTVPGADADHVCYLRTVDDSMRIRDAAKNGGRVVSIGAGYIGTEVCASLRGLGLEAAMIGREDRLWNKFASRATGNWLREYFEKQGVTCKMNAEVASISENGVRLASGEVLPADLVVVGIGVRLNLGLARDGGLAIDEQHGVIVDPTLRTQDPSIWAAGDIAAYEDVNFGKRWHLEHYMNAVWQGTHVGRNMAGASEPFTKVPYFYSDMFDLHFVLRGDPQGGKSAKVIGDMEAAEFTELYAYADGRLAMGLVFTRDADRQDQIGDRLEQYILERRQVADLDESAF